MRVSLLRCMCTRQPAAWLRVPQSLACTALLLCCRGAPLTQAPGRVQTPSWRAAHSTAHRRSRSTIAALSVSQVFGGKCIRKTSYTSSRQPSPAEVRGLKIFWSQGPGVLYPTPVNHRSLTPASCRLETPQATVRHIHTPHSHQGSPSGHGPPVSGNQEPATLPRFHPSDAPWPLGTSRHNPSSSLSPAPRLNLAIRKQTRHQAGRDPACLVREACEVVIVFYARQLLIVLERVHPAGAQPATSQAATPPTGSRVHVQGARGRSASSNSADDKGAYQRVGGAGEPPQPGGCSRVPAKKRTAAHALPLATVC